MAVDTEEKRKSAIAFALYPFFPGLPAGDGTISQADRQQVTGAYAGILSGGAPPPSGNPWHYYAQQGGS
jgi:hypothetical protein